MPNSNYFYQQIQNANCAIFPILGFDINSRKLVKFDGSSNNKALKTIDLSNVIEFDKYAFQYIQNHNAIGSIGGYLEKRILYDATTHFSNSGRDWHLGVDIFMQAHTPIFAPIAGIIHSFANNQGHGNYGPTLILEHQIEGLKFYTLYGHLSLKSLEQKQIGQAIAGGELFCEIGNYPENGNWPAHLHFQIILDMQNQHGDYPGVCAENDLSFYTQNCPNPNVFLRCNLLNN